MRAAPIRGFFKDSREKYEASIAKKDLEIRKVMKKAITSMWMVEVWWHVE